MSREKRNKQIEQEEPSSATQVIFEWIQAIFIAVIIVVILMTFGARRIKVDGTSMLDTLQDQDMVLVTTYYTPPKNGEIAVISHGEQYADPLIKRIIATQGQTIDIDYNKKQVIVDGVILDEPYIKEPTEKKGDMELPMVIPQGKVFVMGDNRNGSSDSRNHTIGIIDVDDIIGKAQCVIWPFDNAKYLND